MHHCEHDDFDFWNVERGQKKLLDASLAVEPEIEIVVAECPFESEIRGDDRPCACCNECRHQCYMET